ncbi:MAG: CDP-diacylglycerol--serine O-phosphatidyltransferase [Deferribacteraceae bacterium]|jgi:CDP-diacylglycerol--serine O-phosphatidyltransferase|nr:CDP-diacylglycerol--serine O-phosphatidyltransferase [Deferribacteraceae bacterium]
MKNKNIMLPNLLTLLGMLCGIYSIVLASNNSTERAAIFILFAAIFDALDGKVARLVNGESEFGIQLDSLADLVSFGVAPAFLIFQWQLEQYGRVGIMAMFLFAACGALRLARFNVQTKKIGNLFFVGMPIPGAAGILVSSVLFVYELGLRGWEYLPYVYLALVVLLAFLMVSTVPYYSFKKLGFLKTKPFNTIVILVVFLVIVGSAPKITVFTVGLLYMISGFVMIPIARRLALHAEKKEVSQ